MKLNLLHNKKFWICAVSIAALAAAAAIVLITLGRGAGAMPALSLEAPGELSVGAGGEFTVPVTLSALPDNRYPAASLSVTFDAGKLEFLGVDEGNMLVTADDGDSSTRLKLPDWGVNAVKANKDGIISAMYLDITGGRRAFCADGFEPQTRNVLMRLRFRLRASAAPGDILSLTVSDAVLATVTNQKDGSSLATGSNTLNARNGIIRVTP